MIDDPSLLINSLQQETLISFAHSAGTDSDGAVDDNFDAERVRPVDQGLKPFFAS